MRWEKRTNVKITPNDFEERIVSKFLILPKCLNDKYRWLERVLIRQVYYAKEYGEYKNVFGGMSSYKSGGYWVDKEFIDKERD